MDRKCVRKVMVVSVLLAALSIMGCSSAQKVTTIELGMTKSEVLAVMGPPATLTLTEGQPAEYLHYTVPVFSDKTQLVSQMDYSIAIVNGRVDAYGDSASMRRGLRN